MNSQQTAGSHCQLARVDHTVVATADVEGVLPHRWQVLVVAAEQATGPSKKERVSHLSVAIPAQERAADQNTRLLRHADEHRRRRAIRCQRRVAELGDERGAGGEELW
jgi:hypothetical protein